MQLTLNDNEYQISQEALSEAAAKAVGEFQKLYETQPVELKIMVKGLCRAFLAYAQSRFKSDMFKSQGDPTMQMVTILSVLLVETLKNATINATISDSSINIVSAQFESEGESR